MSAHSCVKFLTKFHPAIIHANIPNHQRSAHIPQIFKIKTKNFRTRITKSQGKKFLPLRNHNIFLNFFTLISHLFMIKSHSLAYLANTKHHRISDFFVSNCFTLSPDHREEISLHHNPLTNSAFLTDLPLIFSAVTLHNPLTWGTNGKPIIQATISPAACYIFLRFSHSARLRSHE